MGNYMVKYRSAGCNWVYGCTNSIGEAIELEADCRDRGWTNCWIEARDETTDLWVRIN